MSGMDEPVFTHREMDKVKAENDRLREVLKAVEWGIDNDEKCPACGAYQDSEHFGYCKLAEAS